MDKLDIWTGLCYSSLSDVSLKMHKTQKIKVASLLEDEED